MNGPIALSLLQATMDTYDIRLVLDFTEDDINDLHYYTSSVNSSNVKTPVSPPKRVELVSGFKGIIRRFINFRNFKHQAGEEIFDDWSNVSGAEFDIYRRTTNNINISTPVPSQFLPPNARNGSKNSYESSPVYDLKKGIKRDMSHFEILKTKRQFKSWHSNLISIAATQDVEETLNPDYIPSLENIDLFREKQKYMYAVAVKILKTDIGVEYVGAHENDGDAQ